MKEAVNASLGVRIISVLFSVAEKSFGDGLHTIDNFEHNTDVLVGEIGRILHDVRNCDLGREVAHRKAVIL